MQTVNLPKEILSMKRNLVKGLIFIVLTIFLTGCCCGGGKETVVITPAEGTPEGGGATAGQQLQDLKAAQDQGAITDEEFEKSKEKVLKAQ
jgi:hypothetical protein